MWPFIAWRYTPSTNRNHSKLYLWGPSKLRLRYFSSGTGPIWKCYQRLPDRELVGRAHNKRAAAYFADSVPPEFGYFPAIEIISDITIVKFWIKHEEVIHAIKSWQKKAMTKDVNISYKKQTAARKICTGTAELPL